jgi:hypothetical protein
MKFINMAVISIGIIVLLNAGGIETAATGYVFQLLDGGLADFKNLQFWTNFQTILTVVIAGGVIAGLFGRAPPESYVLGPLIFLLTSVIFTDMLSIFGILWSTGETWVQWVATTIFIVFSFALFTSAISYWRGADG